MNKRRSQIEAAYKRIGILQEIIRRERERAEANPSHQRNVEVGFVERGSTQEDAKDQILRCFNELQVFLDLLKIAHMTACFEAEAMAAIKLMLGQTKTAIEDSRKHKDNWTTKLLREGKSFEGLYEIEQLLPLKESHRKMLRDIRGIRNTFAHNGLKLVSPEVSGEEALPVLLESLAVLI